MAVTKVSVLLPTYNERENLPVAVWLIQRAMEPTGLPWEVIVVDDGSPDGTGAVAAELQRLYGPDRIVLRPRTAKLGLGSAYVHGLASATGSHVAIMDADLSHHPKYIPALVSRANETGAAVVSGTRYRAPGGVCGWDTRRKLTSRGANALASWLLSPGVSDLTGSFRLYERAALGRLVAQCRTRGYTFQMEMAWRARRAGMDIAEVPIVFVDRLYGESKLGAGEISSYLSGLWTLFVE